MARIVLYQCVTRTEYLLAVDGVDDAIHVPAPTRRGPPHDLLAWAVGLFAHTAHDQVRITVGGTGTDDGTSYLLGRGPGVELGEAIVGVQYPTGHTVTRALRRHLARALRGG